MISVDNKIFCCQCKPKRLYSCEVFYSMHLRICLLTLVGLISYFLVSSTENEQRKTEAVTSVDKTCQMPANKINVEELLLFHDKVGRSIGSEELETLLLAKIGKGKYPFVERIPIISSAPKHGRKND